MGFPEASVAELWGFALVVDEEVALGRINRLLKISPKSVILKGIAMGGVG